MWRRFLIALASVLGRNVSEGRPPFGSAISTAPSPYWPVGCQPRTAIQNSASRCGLAASTTSSVNVLPIDQPSLAWLPAFAYGVTDRLVRFSVLAGVADGGREHTMVEGPPHTLDDLF